MLLRNKKQVERVGNRPRNHSKIAVSDVTGNDDPRGTENLSD